MAAQRTKATEGRKAVVLVSGGVDSAAVLAIARYLGYDCHALTFDYGQRHRSEVQAAKRVVETIGATEHKIFPLDIGAFGGSALTDDDIAVPQSPTQGIPVTYVPARNTIFLSIALGWAEAIGARDIFIGVNAVDYSGYPDCRPEFIAAYQHMINLATKAGVEGEQIRLHTPLIDLSKAEIIEQGVDLDVDFSLTVSCYAADEEGRACGVCDSCRLRRLGFEHAGFDDPTRYY